MREPWLHVISHRHSCVSPHHARQSRHCWKKECDTWGASESLEGHDTHFSRKTQVVSTPKVELSWAGGVGESRSGGEGKRTSSISPGSQEGKEMVGTRGHWGDPPGPLPSLPLLIPP